MEAKKEDSRVLRSKRDLRTALVALLQTTPFEKITVGEICKKATINKLTFYKHYSDKYALFNDCVQNMSAEIYSKSIQNDQELFSDPVESCLRLIENTLDECLVQRQLLQTLMYENNSLALTILQTTIQSRMIELIDEYAEQNKVNYPSKNISAFITGGFSFLLLETVLPDKNFSKELFMKDMRKLVSGVISSHLLAE